LAAYRVTHCIITQFSNGAIDTVQLAALTAALDFHFLAVVGGGKRGAAERQCGIPWEISSYFAWLKQTYVLLTELAGMRFSGPDLLKATIHIYVQ